MACNTFNTINLDCYDSTGGIETLYFMQHSNLDTTSLTNGFTLDTTAHTITAIALTSTGSTALFQEVQISDGSGNFVGTREMSLENGSQGRTYELVGNIPKSDGVTRKVLNDMEQNRLLCIVKLNDGRYILLGHRKGGFMTSGTDVSGTGLSDLNGFTIGFSSFEKSIAYEVSSTLITSDYITFA